MSGLAVTCNGVICFVTEGSNGGPSDRGFIILHCFWILIGLTFRPTQTSMSGDLTAYLGEPFRGSPVYFLVVVHGSFGWCNCTHIRMHGCLKACNYGNSSIWQLVHYGIMDVWHNRNMAIWCGDTTMLLRCRVWRLMLSVLLGVEINSSIT